MIRLLSLLGLLVCFQTTTLLSQAHYTVVVGSFVDAKLEDFSNIKAYGFVHAEKVSGNTFQVNLGGYNSISQAEKALRQVRDRGYSSAYIEERQVGDGVMATVIQLASRNVTKEVKWEKYQKAGRLYVILNNESIKVVTGLYDNLEQARKALPDIKKLGFKDAFVKRVSSVFLHEVTEFETQIKEPLIPLSFNQPSGRKSTSRSDRGSLSNSEFTPRSYETTESRPSYLDNIPSSRQVAEYDETPSIRSRTRRNSALELQRVLRKTGVYKGSLDGYYGRQTAAAYKEAMATNRELQQYGIMALYVQQPGSTASNNTLQQSINDLPNDINAQDFIEGATEAIARAYQAYMRFVNFGPSIEVNDLMNIAIQQAYSRVPLDKAPFDYTASYAYNDLTQLIQHIHYIHGAPNIEYTAPCWFFQRHPRETAAAYETITTFAGNNLRLQSCDGFLNWESIRVLQLIAADLNLDQPLNQDRLAEESSARAQLYLNPARIPQDLAVAVERWNRRLWGSLNGWAAKDPLYDRKVAALRVVYYQSYVLLEDHYMDLKFSQAEAKSLALATLMNVVGYHLERFV